VINLSELNILTFGDLKCLKKSNTRHQKKCKKCRYPECPVYNECLDKNNERLFCSRGSTKCTIEKKDAYAYAAPTKLNTGLIVYFIVKKVCNRKKM
jgi:hypothetical protein